MKYYLHSIINSLHQISSYAALLRKNPDKLDDYTKLIENTAHSIDINLQELFQSNITSNEISERLNTNVVVGKKVLIVDDMFENRDILSEIFKTLHCDVKSASNGIEALEIAKIFYPDIIFLDILMPVMDGYETAVALRESGCSSTLIAISALKEDTEKSLFDAWLFKPFTAEHIISLLATQNLESSKKCVKTFDLSHLSTSFKKELLTALDRGALSQSLKLVETLEEEEAKAWLLDRLSMMDFDSILKAVLATNTK